MRARAGARTRGWACLAWQSSRVLSAGHSRRLAAAGHCPQPLLVTQCLLSLCLQHVDPEEAVKVHREVRSLRSLAIHHATFPLTDEPMDEPAQLLPQVSMCKGWN